MTDSDELIVARQMVNDHAPNASDEKKALAALRLENYLKDTYWKGRFFRSRPVPAIHASGAASILSNNVDLIPDPDDE